MSLNMNALNQYLIKNSFEATYIHFHQPCKKLVIMNHGKMRNTAIIAARWYKTGKSNSRGDSRTVTPTLMGSLISLFMFCL